MGRALKYFCDNYVCRVCRGNLKLYRNPETGRWSVACARDPEHYGAWRKRYLEDREQRERVEFVEIVNDRALVELWPWLPRPTVTAEEAIQELYG